MYRYNTLILFLLFALTVPASIYGQQDSLTIATTYIISEDSVDSGDIVSFDRTTQLFRLAREAGDENLFGVVSQDPLLVLETEPDGIPIVRSGETQVNVTVANGPIAAGDYITSSAIAGKGQRADSDHTYIIGVALEPFLGETTPEGSVSVLLSVGTQEEAASRAGTTGVTEATVLNIIQYVIAALIAIGSIYIAFKNFGPNIKDGIVSIGRNPLAKSSIQSMVILNAVLIVLISVGGLFIGVAILLLPI